MLTCAEVLDRAYDEDVRRALAGGRACPPDVEEHRRTCAECRRLLDETAADLDDLPGRLLEAPPATLAARVQTRLGRRYPAAPLHDWTGDVSWAAVGASIALVLAVQLPPTGALGPTQWSLIGAVLAFAASAARDALSLERS